MALARQFSLFQNPQKYFLFRWKIISDLSLSGKRRIPSGEAVEIILLTLREFPWREPSSQDFIQKSGLTSGGIPGGQNRMGKRKPKRLACRCRLTDALCCRPMRFYIPEKSWSPPGKKDPSRLLRQLTHFAHPSRIPVMTGRIRIILGDITQEFST